MGEGRSVRARDWTAGRGERACLTPAGPTAAVIETRRLLPLRARVGGDGGPRAHGHPGSAVVLGSDTYEVVDVQEQRGRVLYRLEPWPREQVIRDRVVYGRGFVGAARAERRRLLGHRLIGPFRIPLEMLAALLPSPERRSVADRLALDVLRGTFLVGILQVLLGGILWPVGYIAFYRAHLERLAAQPHEQQDLTARDYSEADAYAAASPILYATRWSSLGLLYLFVTGAARLVHSRVAGQALGDPALALVFGAVRRARSRERDRARRHELGPERPDRVVEDGADLLVLSAREKEGWSGRATIQVGDRFFRVRAVSDRHDGEWKAIRYRLTPVPAGAVFRGLIAYRLHVAAAEAAEGSPSGPAASGPPAAAPLPPPPADPSRPETPRIAAAEGEGPRTRWRVDAGEEARLTPEGPAAAIIESLGSLPVRVRSEAMGVHHRPEFPGTCVVLGGERYEVVAEGPRDTGYAYLLEPWPRENVLRHVVEYGPRLVRAVQRERLEAAERDVRSRYAVLVMPFLGLLPEERQARACDRYGVAPEDATLAGAALEIFACLALTYAASASPLVSAAGLVLGPLVVFPALVRAIGSLAWKDVAGSPLVGSLLEARRTVPGRLDATVLPLTREAFWARLALADRQEKIGPGSVLVKSLLPHLGWGSTAVARAAGMRPVIEAGGERWNVTPLPPVLDQGRLTYAYQLWLSAERLAEAPLEEAAAPDPRTYQREVLAEMSRQWDGVFARFPWVPTLLPRAVQERAYRGRGGVDRGRRWAAGSALACVLVSAWFFAGHGPISLATGVLLLVDGLQRLLSLARGGCGPSLAGSLLAPCMEGERAVYHTHRDAERETLLVLRSAKAA